jgi:hypothetical protein
MLKFEKGGWTNRSRFPMLPFMKSLLIAAFAVLFSLSVRAVDRPNVVMLLADDLGCERGSHWHNDGERAGAVNAFERLNVRRNRA